MISDDNIRSWWDSLDPNVQDRLREVIHGTEVTVDPDALPFELETQANDGGGLQSALTELNTRIEAIKYAIERATLAYFELDFAVEGFLAASGHDLRELQEPLWRPLAEPKMALRCASMKLRVLSGLIEELELATESNPRRPLEYLLELAKSEGNREQRTLIEEAVRLRVRYLGRCK